MGEDIIMACTCDIAGQVRGKGFPARHWDRRRKSGVGWTPTNLMITAFGPIADSPWGPFGDLVLMPDPEAKVQVGFDDETADEHVVLSDICEMDGTPWSCCPRHFLKSALAALEREFGLRLLAAFEHEFFYSGGDEAREHRYGLEGFRRQGGFAGQLFRMLDAAGCAPETFMAEYGVAQYEITVGPTVGLAAADRAIFLRELTRAVAARCGERASFVPKAAPDKVGSGVHVHMSLLDGDGKPAGYDAGQPYGLSETFQRFAAGIVAHAPALVALTAPSLVSYHRLVPHTWSAAWTNLGYRDREALLRICPVPEGPGLEPAGFFNLEFRACDAAASPYIALGALVWAGLEGLRGGLPAPPVTTVDPETMGEAARRELGLARLPASLGEALDRLEQSDAAKAWMGEAFFEAYLAHKRFEAKLMAELSPAEQCRAYAAVY